MSLEAALQANTDALKALAAIIAGASAGKPPLLGADPAVIASAKAASAKNTALAAEKKPEPAAVTYDQVVVSFLELIKIKGRDAALAAITPLPALNAVKVKEQHAGQYAELLAKIKDALKPATAATSLV